MFLVDSHCHLDALTYPNQQTDIATVLEKAQACGVGHVLSAATTLEGFCLLQHKAASFPSVSLACGVHPLNLTHAVDTEQLYQLASHPQVVAIGETGLDYHYQTEHREEQRRAFCQHIAIARQLNKPLIVHTRQATQDTLALLKSENAAECSGVLHCFNDDRATVKALLDLNFYLSLSGLVTFHNAQLLRTVVASIPLDRLLIETDSPYLAPVPYRGRENQPAYLREVAQTVAALKGTDLETLASATTENFCRLFKCILPSFPPDQSQPQHC